MTEGARRLSRHQKHVHTTFPTVDMATAPLDWELPGAESPSSSPSMESGRNPNARISDCAARQGCGGSKSTHHRRTGGRQKESRTYKYGRYFLRVADMNGNRTPDGGEPRRSMPSSPHPDTTQGTTVSEGEPWESLASEVWLFQMDLSAMLYHLCVRHRSKRTRVRTLLDVISDCFLRLRRTSRQGRPIPLRFACTGVGVRGRITPSKARRYAPSAVVGWTHGTACCRMESRSVRDRSKRVRKIRTMWHWHGKHDRR